MVLPRPNLEYKHKIKYMFEIKYMFKKNKFLRKISSMARMRLRSHLGSKNKAMQPWLTDQPYQMCF